MKGKNQKDLKEENTSMLLRLVRDNPDVSRIDVVRETSLTPPTVSRIVAFLTMNGVLSERKADTSNIGRKPFYLAFVGGNFLAIVVEISYTFVLFAIADLNGGIKYKREIKTDTSISNSELKKIILENVNDLKRSFPSVIAVGMSSPGRVDPKKGVIVSIPNLRNISHFDIKDIEMVVNIPVFILNDANAEALAERYFGEGREVKDFLLLHIGFGIGGGFVVNRKLYNGNFGVSLEIGHISIDPNGLKCDCGNIGCVELYASYNKILEDIAHAVNRDTLTEDEVVSLLKNKNSNAIEVIKKKASLIGQMLLSVVNVLAPEKIIVAGPAIKISDFLIPAIKEVLYSKSFYGFGSGIKIVQSKLKENVGLIGAMSVVLEEFLDHPYEFIGRRAMTRKQ